MKIKKLIKKAHLWLGLTSGLLVVFLGITGCILAFELEIENLTQPYRKVAMQQAPLQPPSVLKENAEASLGNGRKLVWLEYGTPGHAAKAFYYNEKEYWQVFLNPYTGEVLKTKNMDKDFFRFIINGHYNLWLPREVGSVITTTGTLIFVVMMISGIVLWWPKNKAARKQRFSIKTSAKWRRVNYDLHNVLGFYVLGIGLCLALSGMIMGFDWFSKSVFWLSSGGKPLPEVTHPLSDSLAARVVPLKTAPDKLWQEYRQYTKVDEVIGVGFPADETAPLEIGINHRPGTYYKQDIYHFDQRTLQPVEAGGVFHGLYRDKSNAEILSRMNYDIHVGAIGGLPTKLLAFFASLVIASLPITGFLIWRGRNKKNKQKIAESSNRPAYAALEISA